MKNLLVLKEYFIEHRWKLVIGVLSLVIVDGLQLIIPRVIKWAIDDLTQGGISRSHLLRYSLYIMAIAIGIGIFRYFWRLFIMGTSRRIEEALRNKLFRHYQSLSFSFFNNHKTGDLMAHATNDIKAVQRAVGMGFVILTDVLFLGTASIGFMLYISPKLTLFALMPAPLLIFFVLRFGRMLHRRFEKVQASFSILTERVRENLSGMRVVKAYVQESNERDKFSQASRDYVEKNMHLVRIWGAFFPLIMLFANLGVAIVLLLGGREVILNSISMGDFVAFISYLNILIWPLMGIGWVTNLLERGSASMGRINKILQTEPEIRDSTGKVEIKGKIELKDLTFSYGLGSPPVLKGINLSICPGEFVAIVGRTGAGKSTLVSLIPHLFDPGEGRLFIDGREIHTLPLKGLRGFIGYVPQDTFLFSDTIRENIAFGKLDTEEERIYQVAQIAGIHQEIIEFPQSYDSVIGERGVTLSGGQKQRLAIARALLVDPQILILDDALSSVDTDTEEEILKNLQRAIRGKTTIIISHRISTIKNADRIFVLDEGKIIEEGTHQGLLASGGLYSRIYWKQQLEEEIEGG